MRLEVGDSVVPKGVIEDSDEWDVGAVCAIGLGTIVEVYWSRADAVYPEDAEDLELWESVL